MDVSLTCPMEETVARFNLVQWAVQLLEGTWYDSECGTKRRHVTQYHEVMHYFVGPWLCYLVQAIVLLVLLGTGAPLSQTCVQRFWFFAPATLP
jgi:hypothetical protein